MKIKLLALTTCLLAATNIFAQNRGHEVGLQSDNDSFLAQGYDRYYTNGIFAYYRQGLRTPGGGDMANKVLGFEIGQKLLNPQSGSVPSADYVDRPFAGYLYAGASLNMLYRNETNLKLTAKVGVIGPAAGGKPIQNFIHNTFGFYPPDGWQYQIRNNMVLNVGAEYNTLLLRGNWADLSLGAYGNLGTAFIGAGAGPMVRLGSFNQLFQSVSTQSTASKSANTLLHPHEIFFYYKPVANVAGYDATVQGDIFKDHPEPGTMEITGDIKRFVFTNQFGVQYAGSRFVFDISAVFSTKDVQGMAHAPEWGSATLLYRFN